MADLTPKTIGELPSAGTLAGTELMALMQSAASKKLTLQDLADWIVAQVPSPPTIPQWVKIGEAAGATAVQIADITDYADIYVRIWYQGYNITAYLIPAFFTNNAQTWAFSFRTQGTDSYAGTLGFSNTAISLLTLYDANGASALTDASIVVYGK